MSADKNSVCRAMGALFLQHRVESLENDVKKMGKLERDPCWFERNRRGGNGESSSRCQIVRKWSNSVCPSRNGSSSRTDSRQTAIVTPRVIVVDASVLIYSMRSVHEWRKMPNTRVVIPEEAVCTLDVLKKGHDRINLAARKAARYLEEHMQCSMGSGSKGQDDHLSTGLFPQLDHQRLSMAAVSQIRQSQKIEEEQLGSTSTQDDFDLKNAPVNVRETFLGFLWFQQTIASLPSGKEAIIQAAVAYPPPSLDDDPEHAGCPYAHRVDGRDVVPWLQAYGFRQKRDENDEQYSILTAPTAASWLEGNAANTAVNGDAACRHSRQREDGGRSNEDHESRSHRHQGRHDDHERRHDHLHEPRHSHEDHRHADSRNRGHHHRHHHESHHRHHHESHHRHHGHHSDHEARPDGHRTDGKRHDRSDAHAIDRQRRHDERRERHAAREERRADRQADRAEKTTQRLQRRQSATAPNPFKDPTESDEPSPPSKSATQSSDDDDERIVIGIKA
ncbi:unnamed protein product [Sympodiomycopsis kandeliae]